MSGKTRPCLRQKTLENVKCSDLSITDKNCIAEVFKRYAEAESFLKPFKPMNLHGCRICECGHVVNEYHNYCSECGQLLDWSE